LRHQVPALTLNPDLTTTAQATADAAKTNGAFASDPTLGENTVLMSKPGDDTFGASPFWAGATSEWYKQFTFYDYCAAGVVGSAATNNDASKFTQLVWKSSTQVGFGYANSGGISYVVANYDPAGNTQK